MEKTTQQKFRRSTFKKNIAGIIALMMLAIALLSALFIAVEADHDCTGEDCPICVCIEQCEQTLRQIGGGMAAGIVSVLPAAAFLFIAVYYFIAFLSETLVSKKVRLNN